MRVRGGDGRRRIWCCAATATRSTRGAPGAVQPQADPTPWWWTVAAAQHPNDVWALDFQFDETADRRRIKLCNIVDEFTREALAIRVARNCTDDVVAVIRAANRRARHVRTPAHGQRPRAHRVGAARLVPGHHTTTSYIDPGSPWENPFVELFTAHTPGCAPTSDYFVTT